ncbi:glycosyltransferase family 2 protein [Nitratifractor salsuginis]|uniref:Glycosyl transferase family 2 n=1 Tax=Nitratifractor salsuginis (strain DSM 16511 / JCM 12458 / E9I37-1) TaxID=749222 RepID=E6WZD2_NITSE|nr:glycosyltransferase family 2 protein [Nitratifractor salsuginis]ADV46644.1 glycosyl transferase family 2 [Nitratifractor salsuginis DSM 16511]
MTCTLLISTYNRPDALQRVLQSALKQTHLPDEIVIADDGSGVETRKTIEAVRKTSPIPLLHAWQPDEDFRAAMARNRALAMSRGDYVVMIDGDMLLHPEFIHDHLLLAREGTFLQGGRILLSPEETKKMIETDNPFPHLFSPGISNRLNALRLPILAKLIAQKGSQTLKGIRTCNFSLFRKDILRVNGFDNRFTGWGREDSEFAARLLHSGLRRRELKFAALAAHLYHPEVTRRSLAENDKRLQHTLNRRCTIAVDGVNRFIDPDGGAQ